MAYGVKYKIKIISPEFLPNDVSGLLSQSLYIEIYEKDYIGGFTMLKTVFDSIKLSRTFSDIEQNILGMSLAFDIKDDSETEEDYFELDDLMFATERKYLVKMQSYKNDVANITMFEGFINTDNTERNYLYFNTISIICSSYLSKMGHFSPVPLDTASNVTYIDLILSMISDIGSTANVRVNSSLIPTEDSGIQAIAEDNPGYSLYNKVGCSTELFWENNLERRTAYDVLSEILKITNAYIYWWDGFWYIERYNNIWTTTGVKNYVQYDVGNTYSPSETGLWKIEDAHDIKNIHALTFIETTQRRKTSVGCKEIVVKINEKQLSNLVPDLFSPITDVTTNEPYIAELRRWTRFVDEYTTWDKVDSPYRDIENAIYREILGDPYGGNPTPDQSRFGLYSNFIITVTDETEITIKFSFNCSERLFKDEAIWFFPMSLKIFEADGANNAFVCSNFDEGNEEWWLDDSTTTVHSTLWVRQEYSTFDQRTRTAQVSLTIPLYELNQADNTKFPVTLDPTFTGNFKMQITVGLPKMLFDEGSSGYRSYFSHYIGDIKVTISGNELENNYISGTINTDFLNKKEISVDMADVSDWSFLNGICRADDLLSKTSLWKTSISSAEKPILDLLLEDKFRFYNITRSVITGNVAAMRLFRPLSLFIDDKKSDMKFVLFGYEYKPVTGVYDLYLLEYDNETEVTLTDA